MVSSKTTSQAPQRRSPGLFTNFHEEDTTAQPPSQLRGHPPRVTTHGLSLELIVMERSTLMQECKARTPRVLKSLTPKSHQSNKC
jgi:hypothetical protein